jgi:hypothetical protein
MVVIGELPSVGIGWVDPGYRSARTRTIRLSENRAASTSAVATHIPVRPAQKPFAIQWSR